MSPQTESHKNGKSSRSVLIVVIMLGLFVTILNQTLLNVALPTLTNDFGIASTTAQWLLTAYMLVNGVLIPLSAFLVQRFGTRTLFIAAMFFFTVGSLICGIATSFSIMLIGRIVQAIGGGILMPLVMTIILDIFPPENRGKGMGLFALVMMFAPAIGPTLSGWVVEHYNWRLLFNGIAPLSGIVTVLAFFVLKNTEEQKKVKLDVSGTITSIIGFGSLLYGFSEAGSKGWGDPIVVSTLILGVIMLIAFVTLQLRSENPMLNLRVLKYEVFTLSIIVNAVVTVGLFAGMILLPIYTQNLLGFTPMQSGMLMLPGAIVMAIMSPIAGILFDKVGPRPMIAIGSVILVFATWEFTHLTLETSYAHIAVLNATRSFGMGFMMTAIMTGGMNQLPKEMNSHGTAVSNTIRQVAGSIGTSFVTTIFSNRTSFHYAAYAEHTNTMDPNFMHTFQSFVKSVMETTGLGVTQAQQTAASLLAENLYKQAAVAGITDAFFWAVGFSIIGLVLGLFMRDVRKDSKRRQKKRAIDVIELPAPSVTSET